MHISAIQTGIHFAHDSRAISSCVNSCNSGFMVCGLRTGLDGRAEIDGSPMTRKWYLTAAQAAQMNLSPVPPLLDEQIARHNAAVAADREHDAKVAEIVVDSLLVG